MKSAILAFTIAGTIASAAFAQSVGEKTGVNSALGIAPKTEDFIKEAATSDMLEIEAAKARNRKEILTKRGSPIKWSRIIPRRVRS